MQDYNTIIGVLIMRHNNCSLGVIQDRHRIGSGTVQLILRRFEASRLTLEELKAMNPHSVEDLIYPRDKLQRKDIPMPDFQYYYDRIHTKGSKMNIAYCWLEYKRENPNGYGQSQFYEYYNRFVRAERQSVIISTNRSFSNWTEMFENSTMVTALVGRLTYKSHVLNMNSEHPYREEYAAAGNKRRGTNR